MSATATVDPTDCEADDTLWYYAYGSNLSLEVLTHGRGIEPLAATVARIPGWRLSMSIPGLPYREPAFASIESFDPVRHNEKDHDVEGVAYLITVAQYAQIIASEGGDIAYAQAILDAKILELEHEARAGQHHNLLQGRTSLRVHTLVNAIRKTPPGNPSMRYMEILIAGATTSSLSSNYLRQLEKMQTYSPGRSSRYRMGAYLFLLVWSPVMKLIEFIVKSTVDRQKGGTAPDWSKALVRFLVASMWISHEFHSVIWGRGDGLDTTSSWRDANDA